MVTAVRSALQMVPRPEGRRVLLLLGGGWPTRSPVPTTDEAEGSPFQGLPTTSTREGRFDDRALLADLANSANLLGYTLYPVDIQGLRPRESAVEAEVVATEPESGLAPAHSSSYTGELFRQGTLRFLAHEIGGRPMLFDGRIRVLEAVVEDTRSYYSLGFMPDLRGDGAYYRIRVQVGRPGLREGYPRCAMEYPTTAPTNVQIHDLVAIARRIAATFDTAPGKSAHSSVSAKASERSILPSTSASTRSTPS